MRLDFFVKSANQELQCYHLVLNSVPILPKYSTVT